MALIEFKFFSESLGMQTEVYIVMPQNNRFGEIGTDSSQNKKTEKYKCLYLLHGLSDDHTIWLRRTSIERYAAKYNICVVMPMAARSYYSDMKYGEKYYTYIAEELPFVMGEFFNVSDKREDNFVSGLSMGGYGCLKIALRNPDRFCAAAAFSPATDINKRKDTDLFKNVFGEVEKAPDEDNLFYLAEKQKDHKNKPRLFIGIGTEDFLYEETSRLVNTLRDGKYDLTYRESPGTHNWEFWDEYIQYALAWMFE